MLARTLLLAALLAASPAFLAAPVAAHHNYECTLDSDDVPLRETCERANEKIDDVTGGNDLRRLLP